MSLPRLGLGGPYYSPRVWLEAEEEIDGSRYNGDGPWVVLLRGRKRRLEWRCELAVRLHFSLFLMDKCFSFFPSPTPTILLLFHSVPSLSLPSFVAHTPNTHTQTHTYVHWQTCTHTHVTHVHAHIPNTHRRISPSPCVLPHLILTPTCYRWFHFIRDKTTFGGTD